MSCRDDGTLKAPEQFCNSLVALLASLPHWREETIRLAEVGHEAIQRISCRLFAAAIKLFCSLPSIEEAEKISVVPWGLKRWNFMPMWGVGARFVIYVKNIDDHAQTLHIYDLLLRFLEYNRKIKKTMPCSGQKTDIFLFRLIWIYWQRNCVFPKKQIY